MRKEEWTKHIEAQEKSGISISAYCREQGLSEKSFGYQTRVRSRGFVQVSGREFIEVALPQGAILRVPGSEIRNVLKALQD